MVSLARVGHIKYSWEAMIQSRTYSRYRFVIGGLTVLSHFGLGASYLAVSPILPLITDEYGVSHATSGLLVGVVMIMSAIFGIPGGFIVGRLGLRRTYTIALFMVGLLTLSALSPGFWGLLVLRVLYGLGFAAFIPANGPLLMQWFRPRELPVINGMNMAGVSLGIMLSLSTAAPLSDRLGWEMVLGIFGAIGLFAAFAWLLLGRVRGGAETLAVAPVALKEVWEVLRNRTVFLLGIADAACFSLYVALTGWLPTFYNETRGMSLTEAGLIISVLPFVGIFGVLLGGVLPAKIESRRLFFIVPGALVGLGGLGSFLLGDLSLIYLSVILLGLGAWLYQPMLMTLPMELPGMTPQRVAIAWGWFMTTSGVTTFISPLAVGALRDGTGSFIPGFLIFGVLAWFLLIVGLLLPKTGTQSAQAPDTAASPAPAQD